MKILPAAKMIEHAKRRARQRRRRERERAAPIPAPNATTRELWGRLRSRVLFALAALLPCDARVMLDAIASARVVATGGGR